MHDRSCRHNLQLEKAEKNKTKKDERKKERVRTGRCASSSPHVLCFLLTPGCVEEELCRPCDCTGVMIGAVDTSNKARPPGKQDSCSDSVCLIVSVFVRE